MIIHGKMASDWEGIIPRSKATLDTETGEIKTEMVDIEGLGHLSLDREWFEPDNYEELSLDNEIPVCMICHEYIMKFVMNDTDGTNLEEGLECSNPDCEGNN